MKKETREVYVCESCGRAFVNQYDHSQEQCFEYKAKVDRERIEYDEKMKRNTELAIEAARQSKVLRLLVSNGLEQDALRMAEDVYNGVSGWDCGCSHGMEGIYRAMIEAVK